MKFKCTLVAAAMVLCLGALPGISSAMLIDVRVISGEFIVDPKTVYAYPGGQVVVGVFLSGLETEAGGTNGLGAFQFSVRSLNEGEGGLAQATSSFNNQNVSAFDFLYSNGTLADCTIAADTDTDLDVIDVHGRQRDGGTPYQPGIGNGQEVLLGTAGFTVGSVFGFFDLNTYYNGRNVSYPLLGGLSIRRLINTATDDTNGVFPLELASAAEIGSPVHVLVLVPEPMSLCLIGVAALSLLGHRRSLSRRR